MPSVAALDEVDSARGSGAVGPDPPSAAAVVAVAVAEQHVVERQGRVGIVEQSAKRLV